MHRTIAIQSLDGAQEVATQSTGDSGSVQLSKYFQKKPDLPNYILFPKTNLQGNSNNLHRIIVDDFTDSMTYLLMVAPRKLIH